MKKVALQGDRGVGALKFAERIQYGRFGVNMGTNYYKDDMGTVGSARFRSLSY